MGWGSSPLGIPQKGSPWIEREVVGMERESLQMKKLIPAMEKAGPTGSAIPWQLPWLAALRLWQTSAPLGEASGVLSWLPLWEQAPCPCFAPRSLCS